MRIRTIVSGIACGIALAGGAYGVYALLNAILSASPLTQFLLSISGLGAGGLVTYLSVKERMG